MPNVPNTKKDINDLKNYMVNDLNYHSVTDYISKHNQLGLVFAIHIRDTIQANGTLQFAMKIPKDSIKIIEALPAMITTDKSLEIDFYKNVQISSSAGNIKDSYIICMNQYINTTSKIEELLASPVITNYGTNSFRDYIPANKYSSGSTVVGLNWLCQQDCYYACKFVNLDNSICKYKFSLYWIEHDYEHINR